MFFFFFIIIINWLIECRFAAQSTNIYIMKLILKTIILYTIKYLPKVLGQKIFSKQYRPRSDISESGFWSWSTLFAFIQQYLDTSGSETDLFKILDK